MKYFIFDKASGNVELEDSRILTVKEFKGLLNYARNVCKDDPSGENQLLVKKEFIYMYMYLDWDSPYFKHPEEDKKLAAFEDSGLTEEDLENPEFITACKKYNELQNDTLDIRLLRACMETVEKVIYYLSTVDPNERNVLDGKPIFKTKDIIAEIKGAKDIITSLKELEDEVKKGLSIDSKVRGDTKLGFFD